MKPPPVDEFNVRAFALQEAVKLYASKGPSSLNPTIRNAEIVEAALTFERHLSRPSADQQQHAAAPADLANLIT